MVEFLARGYDARAVSREEHSLSLHPRDTAVKVFDYEPRQSRAARNRLLQQVRAALGQGQGVLLVPFTPAADSQWEWNEQDLAELTGGMMPDGSASLDKPVEWQCA